MDYQLKAGICATCGLPEPTSDEIRALISALEKFTTVVEKKTLSRLMEGVVA